MLLGIVTSGTALNRSNSINNAARESARFGATLPADNLTLWLAQVSDVAIDSATGDLADGSPGRLICVPYVYPDGVVPMVGGVPVVGTNHTMRVVVDPAGAKTFSPGEPC